mgnify:CR=1 FL=1
MVRAGWVVLSIIAHGRGFPPRSRARLEAREASFARAYVGVAMRFRGGLIKLGQMASLRVDVMPEAITNELVRLQDRVEPHSFDEVEAQLEDELGPGWSRRFSSFERAPIAAASLGQVHAARARDGEKLAVKVLYPGIERSVAADLRMARLALWLFNFFVKAELNQIYREIQESIQGEMDYLREGRAAEEIARNLATDAELWSHLRIPGIRWDTTTRRVLTMEFIEGVKINDYAASQGADKSVDELVRWISRAFLHMIFRDGFFHADMHPGNIFIGPDGQYRAVDFGIMGTLSDRDKRYLAENFLAFFNRDYRGVAEAHLRAGWVPPDTDADEFESAIRAVCEPIFAKPISEISFARLIVRLFQTARRFNMPIQPQLVLLQKTLFNIEGLGRQLYPDLDLWETAKPYLERWMRDQVGPAALIRGLRRELPRLVPMIPELPAIGVELLRKTRDQDSVVPTHSEELRQLRLEMHRRHRQLLGMLAGCAVLLAGVISLGVVSTPGIGQSGSMLGGGLLVVAGLVTLVIHWPKNPRV